MLRAYLGSLLMLLPALALAQPPRDVSGLYEIRQMEMAGGLELSANGHFRYALEYGAASEQAEGKWRSDGVSVLLTSDPMPKSPTFELVKDEPLPKGELVVQLAPPGFGDTGYRVRAVVRLKGIAELQDLDLDQDGRADLGSVVPEMLIPRVPVYGDLGPAIPLSADRGHKLLIRFVPNDLGKPRFQDERLSREGDTLVLQRYDAKIVFKLAERN